MGKLKRKFQNGLASVLVFGGMSLFSGVNILSGVYLQYTQPQESQIVSEYRGLNQELHYLNSAKFSLEEALDSNHIAQYAKKADSLSARIKSIESSEDYSKITNYEEEKSRHNKYWLIPFISMAIGSASMMYGVHIEAKINSRPSEK